MCLPPKRVVFTFRHLVTCYLGLDGCMSCEPNCWVNELCVQAHTADCSHDDDDDDGYPKQACSRWSLPP